MAEKVVGILGGMGPDATVDLMQRIIRLTPALDDIDHIRCIIDNNPKVPSRIKAIIEGHGEDPGPHMAEMGRKLEAYGADFLVIACNTAHNYYRYVQEAVAIPVINLIGAVTNHIVREYSGKTRIGILASPAVKMTKLYSRQFESFHLTDVWPESQFQEQLLHVIKSIKAGNSGEEVKQSYLDVCRHLMEKEADMAVIACTELGTLNVEPVIPIIDAAQVLAEEIVDIVKKGKELVTYQQFGL